MAVLITGGCGFLGTNLAHRLLSARRPVHLFDNLSRPGSERNLFWLKEQHKEEWQKELLTIEIADVRDWRSLSKALKNASEVYHFASQEAISVSRSEPLMDFDVNVRGTFHLLNAIRESGRRIPLIFTSTHKVYGTLTGQDLQASAVAYQPCERKFIGVDEQSCLDPQGSFACSKAAAELYVLDFARSYQMPALVFRIGSVYGPHQYGNEDHGWVAHLLLRTLRSQPVTIYGDGRQVRDLLHIDDLINAFLVAQASIDRLKGQAFNLGGGVENALSLVQFIELAGRIGGRIAHVKFAPWRLLDQRYYASDYSKFRAITRWAPRIDARQGIEQLYRWMVDTRQAPPLVLPSINQEAPSGVNSSSHS